MTSTAIELEERHVSRVQDDLTVPATPQPLVGGDYFETSQEFSLPLADRGKHAWGYLAASFFLEAIVWGFPFSFGVFQDYYQTHEPFTGSTGIATIGTCALGIMYFDFPIIIALQRRYPRAARWAPTGGLLALSFSLMLSSFSQHVTHLILTQGVMYAIAASVSYCPCMLWLEEWFVQRRGLAFGIMWSGTGVGGVLIPLLLQTFLERFGFRTTLRIWAVCLSVLSIPVFFFVKPRLPPSSTMRAKPLNLGFVINRTFLFYQSANIIESLGYFLPALYLPAYARTVFNAKPFLAALTVILINLATALGTVVVGHMVDKWHVTTCILISTVGTVLGTFMIWGFASNLTLLYLFCVTYGLFAGSYVATWPGITRQVILTRVDSESPANGRSFDPIMMIGFLTAGRGVGNIISGPLSEVLLKAAPSPRSMIWGHGGYSLIIAFTGSTAFLGGMTWLWRRLGWI